MVLCLFCFLLLQKTTNLNKQKTNNDLFFDFLPLESYICTRCDRTVERRNKKIIKNINITCPKPRGKRRFQCEIDEKNVKNTAIFKCFLKMKMSIFSRDIDILYHPPRMTTNVANEKTQKCICLNEIISK